MRVPSDPHRPQNVGPCRSSSSQRRRCTHCTEHRVVGPKSGHRVRTPVCLGCTCPPLLPAGVHAGVCGQTRTLTGSAKPSSLRPQVRSAGRTCPCRSSRSQRRCAWPAPSEPLSASGQSASAPACWPAASRSRRCSRPSPAQVLGSCIRIRVEVQGLSAVCLQIRKALLACCTAS